MTSRLRPVGYDDRLNVGNHLDELRSRLFVCLAVLSVAFGICVWQSGRIEHLLNRGLDHLSKVGSMVLIAVDTSSMCANSSLAIEQSRSKNGRAFCRLRKLNNWYVSFIHVDVSPNLPRSGSCTIGAPAGLGSQAAAVQSVAWITKIILDMTLSYLGYFGSSWLNI